LSERRRGARAALVALGACAPLLAPVVAALGGGLSVNLAAGCSEGIAPHVEDAGPDVRPPRLDPCDSGVDGPYWCEPAEASTAELSCRGGAPDSVCDPSVEGCDCVDCADAARCNDRCVDDGFCSLAGEQPKPSTDGGPDGGAEAGAGGEAPGGEDCTCLDCDLRVAACAPPPHGCKDDGVCSLLSDDCTCADCAGDRGCQACVDNGVCVPYLEGCNCADCAGLPPCAGPPPGASAAAPAGGPTGGSP
jgi:hypothetical protein